MSDDGITRLNTRLAAEHAALIEAVAATDGEPFVTLDLDLDEATAAAHDPTCICPTCRPPRAARP